MNVEALGTTAVVVETYDPLSQDREGRAVQRQRDFRGLSYSMTPEPNREPPDVCSLPN